MICFGPPMGKKESWFRFSLEIMKKSPTSLPHLCADDCAVKLFSKRCVFGLCSGRFHAGATKQSLGSHKDGDSSQFKTKFFSLCLNQCHFFPPKKLKVLVPQRGTCCALSTLSSMEGRVFKIIIQFFSETLI